jgi:hypothetical protein
LGCHVIVAIAAELLLLLLLLLFVGAAVAVAVVVGGVVVVVAAAAAAAAAIAISDTVTSIHIQQFIFKSRYISITLLSTYGILRVCLCLRMLQHDAKSI